MAVRARSRPGRSDWRSRSWVLPAVRFWALRSLMTGVSPGGVTFIPRSVGRLPSPLRKRSGAESPGREAPARPYTLPVPEVAYLDHAATTPLRPEALAAMTPYLTGTFGNPSGLHSVAREAKTALEVAREQVAGALGCDPSEVVFTAGGTEADNLAVL